MGQCFQNIDNSFHLLTARLGLCGLELSWQVSRTGKWGMAGLSAPGKLRLGSGASRPEHVLDLAGWMLALAGDLFLLGTSIFTNGAAILGALRNRAPTGWMCTLLLFVGCHGIVLSFVVTVNVLEKLSSWMPGEAALICPEPSASFQGRFETAGIVTLTTAKVKPASGETGRYAQTIGQSFPVEPLPGLALL